MEKNYFKCKFCERNVYLKDKEKHLEQCNVKSYLSSNSNNENDEKENKGISQEKNKNVNLPPSYNNHEDTNFALQMQFQEYDNIPNYRNEDSELAKNLQILEYNKMQSQLKNEKKKMNKNIHNYYNDGPYDMNENTKYCFNLLQYESDELSNYNNRQFK